METKERKPNAESSDNKQKENGTRIAGTQKSQLPDLIIEVTEIPNHRKEVPRLLLGIIIVLAICYGLWLLIDYLLNQI
jgi:hypothetical protein